MRILAIDSASGGCRACLVEDGVVLGSGRIEAVQGLAGLIPPLLDRLTADAGMPEAVAVVVGPGSFTGLRAGMACGLGIGAGLGVPVVGVSASEAWGDLGDRVGGRALWTCVSARRARVFIDGGDGFAGFDLDALPVARGRVAIAGDAANVVASALAARGADIMLTRARLPECADVAAVGLARVEGRLPPLEVQPLYVDEPEAKRPAGGLRPPPTP